MTTNSLYSQADHAITLLLPNIVKRKSLLSPSCGRSNIYTSVASQRAHKTRSKHILNAQVSVRSPCCTSLCLNPNLTGNTYLQILTCCVPGKKWFDCVECHTEQESHPLAENYEMVFACKKCKKCFRKNATEFEEADEYCPHCDNHFIIEAKTPRAALSIESEDVRMDSKMLKDERAKQQALKTIFDPTEDADKLG